MSQAQSEMKADEKAKSLSAPVNDLQSAEMASPGLQRSAAPLGTAVQRWTPSNVLYMQRAIGNAAVQRLIAPNRTRSAPQPSVSQHHVSQQSAPTIQRKLTVGPANDKYEREADDISKQVLQRSLTDRVQRDAKPQVGPEGGQLDDKLASQIRGSGGSSMPKGVRSKIESKTGADLSPVKVHTDSHAANLNRQLGAKAFTHKNHIYYGQGQSPTNVKLTAHEAVHTIQQGATKVKEKSEEMA
jgi:hypothetical protein